MTDSSTASAGKIIVHHLNNSRSQRILWLLEELGVPYEIKKYHRTPEQKAPEELKAVNPIGSAPVITDGSVNLAESGAIVEYIIRKHGNGRARPSASGEVADLYYTHASEGSLMPLIVNSFVTRVITDRMHWLIRPLIGFLMGKLRAKLVDSRLRIQGQLIEQRLTEVDGGWIAGGEEPTTADYMMIFPLECMSRLCPEYLGINTERYLRRVHERPAYRRALDLGGKYDYAP
ncbi:thioredoxin-like protein [Fomitopsis serialis]|uniref:thioredoxin-like protein n=1 Tax=Fomitopsis serialis TaxID=139415 RepID=UPI0020089A5B|nr:thioredoxin-like protein [Neoantrodia serialis]KAH9933911.1 thioredoxin-like protein [Neoantrodia serialis]